MGVYISIDFLQLFSFLLACRHARMHTCTYHVHIARTYTRHAWTYTHTHTHMSMCTHARIHVRMYMSERTYVRTYIHACERTHIHTYAHKRRHTHITSRIHAYTHTSRAFARFDYALRFYFGAHIFGQEITTERIFIPQNTEQHDFR